MPLLHVVVLCVDINTINNRLLRVFNMFSPYPYIAKSAIKESNYTCTV